MDTINIDELREREQQNEKELNDLADMLDPLSVIFTDEEIKRENDNDAPMIKIVQMALRKHPKEVIELLAIMDGVPVEEYKFSKLTLPLKLTKMLNNPEVTSLFR